MNLRPELATHLRSRLQAFGEGFRHNLALLGPPGSGKTFQLQQLVTHPVPPHRYIYCALYRESAQSFLQRFLGAILTSGVPTQEALPTLLQRLEPHAPKTVSAVRVLEPILARHAFAEAFTRILDLIPLLNEERGGSTVLILDEFLCLEELGFVHAFHELGKRVMTWPTTLFILSSSSQHRARSILRERLQLLFGQFELLTLEALESHTVSAWVQHELKGMRGAKMLRPFLAWWLGAYPSYLNVFLKRLRELSVLGGQPELTEPLFLQTAWDVLGSTESLLHHWCVSRTERLAHLRLGSRAMEALIQIADGTRTASEVGRRIGRARLGEALQLLVEQDLTQRNGMCWVVTDPILRCWLSTVVAAQRCDARVDETDVRQRFEHYVRALWARWLRTHQLSFTEQIVGLFNAFCDETVSLDSKTGRLPHFDTVTTHTAPPPAPGAYLIAEGQGKRWCASVQEGVVEEPAVAGFDAFCRTQQPKPSRKVLVTKASVEPNARLLAKAANMWVWQADALNLLTNLYG